MLMRLLLEQVLHKVQVPHDLQLAIGKGCQAGQADQVGQAPEDKGEGTLVQADPCTEALAPASWRPELLLAEEVGLSTSAQCHPARLCGRFHQ